jgi:hypothetical protein
MIIATKFLVAKTRNEEIIWNACILPTPRNTSYFASQTAGEEYECLLIYLCF